MLLKKISNSLDRPCEHSEAIHYYAGLLRIARKDVLLYFLGFLCCLLVSCTGKSSKNADVIVTVGDKTLTRTDLEESLPPFLTPDDSIMATEHYVRIWISDHLLYDVAQKNIADKKSIEQLVENYRRSLIIYQYQEQLVNEKLGKEISDEALWNYYEENKDKFKLDKPLVKGLFLRVPVEAPQIDKVRSWYQSASASAITNIEKYSVQNAASYDYFVDNWKDFSELMNNWPSRYSGQSGILKTNKFLEQRDSSYYYFLHITDSLLPGDNAPFDYAKSTIKEMLINRKKIDFLRKTEDDLYNKALKSGKIKFSKEYE
jgi:hypothetical protein